MKERRTWKTLLFRIDLTKIEGGGEFSCPSCGSLISPDDESELNYEILDVKTNGEGKLRGLLIVCKKCRNKISLEGFEMLDGLEDMDGLNELEENL